MGISFRPEDFQLTPLERSILEVFVKRKKFVKSEKVEFSHLFFNEIKEANLRKKTEDSLKFIFKKTLQHLKRNFQHRVLEDPNLGGEELDNRFYEWHFGDISRMFAIPLESFFHFRNWQRRTSPHIPKSITKRYISRLKLNKGFIKNFTDFLDHHLLKSFFKFNSKKIRSLVFKWENLLENFGREQGLATILKQINSKGNKFPWTVKEVVHARRVTYKYLRQN